MSAANDLGEHGPGEPAAQSTILLADDTQVTVEIERAYFASVGFRVVVASNPKQVEDLVRSESIDLLMIDVNFARDQGLGTVRAARRASRNDQMKILVTSILSNPTLRKNAEAHGADDFLVKPAPRPKVLMEIKKLTSQAARHGERIRRSLDVTCRVGPVSFLATTLDLSSDGMHLVAKNDITRPDVGATVSVEIQLGKSDKPLILEGSIVRHTQEGFGLRFGEVGKNTRRALDKFLLRFSMEHRASQYYL